MKIIIGVVILLLLILIGIKWLTNASKEPCPEPAKPNKVPTSAIWKGGCDGGNWMDLVQIENELYRFEIYRDYDGELLLDANFKAEGCGQFILNKSNWTTVVQHYINESITVYDSQGCKLIPIYPAFAGEDWETKKSK